VMHFDAGRGRALQGGASWRVRPPRGSGSQHTSVRQFSRSATRDRRPDRGISGETRVNDSRLLIKEGCACDTQFDL
jgi:hypothetical protein